MQQMCQKFLFSLIVVVVFAVFLCEEVELWLVINVENKYDFLEVVVPILQ